MSNEALQYAYLARLSELKICRLVDLRVRENLDRKKKKNIRYNNNILHTTIYIEYIECPVRYLLE